MFSFSNLKYAAILIAIVASFSFGWKTKGWYEDSKDLAAQKAVKEAQSAIAKQLEEKIQDLRANERVVEKEKLRIIEKPVYKNICLDEEAVALINKSKQEVAK